MTDQARGRHSSNVYFVAEGTEDINCLCCVLFRPSRSPAAAWKEWLSRMGGTRKKWQTGRYNYKARKFTITIEAV